MGTIEGASGFRAIESPKRSKPKKYFTGHLCTCTCIYPNSYSLDRAVELVALLCVLTDLQMPSARVLRAGQMAIGPCVADPISCHPNRMAAIPCRAPQPPMHTRLHDRLQRPYYWYFHLRCRSRVLERHSF